MHALPIEDPARFHTRYRLLEVAARHIALHGLEGASLRGIAAEAGVTAAAIYRHYPKGKRDLYEATLGLVSEAVSALVRDATDVDASAVEQVVAQCDAMWEFCEDYPSVAAMVVRENIAGGPDGPSPYLDEHVRAISTFRGFLESAIEKGEIRPMNVSAFLFWVGTHVTSFHGCGALREATWTPDDMNNARADFLERVREWLGADDAREPELEGRRDDE